MSEFLGAVYEFFYTLVNDIISMVANIMDFIGQSLNSVNVATSHALPGMIAIRGLIETLPVAVFATMAACICILLVISVLKIFL